MARLRSMLSGPEAAMALLGLAVFALVARHNTYSAVDVAWIERGLWLLPLMAVPFLFATLRVPGNRTGWWLVRTNVALFAGLSVCAYRMVSALGPPGSGPKGQDAGFLVVIALGGILASLANAMAGAVLLAERRPAFAAWFRQHRALGVFLVVLAAVPIGCLLLPVVGFALGALAAVVVAFQR